MLYNKLRKKNLIEDVRKQTEFDIDSESSVEVKSPSKQEQKKMMRTTTFMENKKA